MQHNTFFSFEWEDDARHNQTVYNIATGHGPIQTMYQAGKLRIFNDHFTPIYFLIALFYKIYPHIFTWYFLMCLTYACSSIFVFLMAKDALGDDRKAFLISVIYLSFPPLHYATLGALDAGNFTVMPIFAALYFMTKKKMLPFVISMAIACMCRDDVPLYFVLLGFYQLFRKYPLRWFGATLVFSICYFCFAIYMTNTFCRVMTEGGGGHFDYIDLSTLYYLIIYVVTDFENVLNSALDWHKLRFFVIPLTSLLFIPLFSLKFFIPFIILGVEVGIPEGFDNLNSYYLAPLIPFLFAGFISASGKIKAAAGDRKFTYVLYAVLAMCIFMNTGRNLIGWTAEEKGMHIQDPYGAEYDTRYRSVNNIFDRRLYAMDQEDKNAHDLLRMIPDHASVTASGDLLPYLSSRNVLYEFALNHPNGYESEFDFWAYPSYEVDFIMINRKCLINGLGGRFAFLPEKYLNNEIEHIINDFDFEVTAEEGSYILLKNKKK